MEKYNVLSLCDGISTAQLAMKLAGIEYGYYVASEIDPYAIKTAQHNYPATLQVGNIYNINVAKIPFKIHIVFMGFPCQSFSLAGKQGKFDDPRGQIFWQGIKVYMAVRKLNPDVKFLFENVRMDKRSEAIITDILGVPSVKIDSALVCAQTRKRNYWCNFGPIEQPEDREIYLSDILQDNVDPKYNLSEKIFQRINKDEVLKKLYALKLGREKSRAVISSVGSPTHREYFEKNQGQLVAVGADYRTDEGLRIKGNKTGTLPTQQRTDESCGQLVIQLNGSKDSHDQQPYMQHRVYDSAGKAPALSQLASNVNVVAKINKSQDGKVFAITGKSQALVAGHNNVPKVAMGVVNDRGTFREVANDKSLNIDSNYQKGVDNHGTRTVIINTKGNPKNSQNKAACFTAGAHSGGHHSDMDVLVQVQPEDIVVHNLQRRSGKGVGGKGHLYRYPGNKPYCLDTISGQAVELIDGLIIRRLTEVEVCRLQGLPDDYFYDKHGRQIISSTQIYKSVGNGWQADTIAHILSYLK